MEDMNFENKHSTIFPIPTCSNNLLNCTFLSMHPFLGGYTKEMPYLVSSGVETEIKDWRTVKALEAPLLPSPTEILPHRPLSVPSQQMASQTLKPQQMCNLGPQLWQTNARSKTHDTFSIHTAYTGVKNHSTMTWETHTLFHTRTYVLPPHFHSKRPPMLIEPPTWKITSGVFKIHPCLLLTSK